MCVESAGINWRRLRLLAWVLYGYTLRRGTEGDIVATVIACVLTACLLDWLCIHALGFVYRLLHGTYCHVSTLLDYVRDTLQWCWTLDVLGTLRRSVTGDYIPQYRNREWEQWRERRKRRPLEIVLSGEASLLLIRCEIGDAPSSYCRGRGFFRRSCSGCGAELTTDNLYVPGLGCSPFHPECLDRVLYNFLFTRYQLLCSMGAEPALAFIITATNMRALCHGELPDKTTDVSHK